MKQLKNSTKSSSQGYRQELGHWLAGPSTRRPPRLRLRQCPGSGPSSKPTGRGQNSLLSLDSGVHVLLLVLDQEPLAPSSRPQGPTAWPHPRSAWQLLSTWPAGQQLCSSWPLGMAHLIRSGPPRHSHMDELKLSQ